MMGSFKIEERENRYYIIPTASYLSTVKEIYTPYDTNFLIYKLFDYEPKEFIHYLCSSFEAKVIISKSGLINVLISAIITQTNIALIKFSTLIPGIIQEIKTIKNA